MLRCEQRPPRTSHFSQHGSMLHNCSWCRAVANLASTRHTAQFPGIAWKESCSGCASDLHHHSYFHKALPGHIKSAGGCAAVAAQEVVCVLQKEGAGDAGGRLGVGHSAAHDIHHLHVFLNSLHNPPASLSVCQKLSTINQAPSRLTITLPPDVVNQNAGEYCWKISEFGHGPKQSSPCLVE